MQSTLPIISPRNTNCMLQEQFLTWQCPASSSNVTVTQRPASWLCTSPARATGQRCFQKAFIVWHQQAQCFHMCSSYWCWEVAKKQLSHFAKLWDLFFCLYGGKYRPFEVCYGKKTQTTHKSQNVPSKMAWSEAEIQFLQVYCPALALAHILAANRSAHHTRACTPGQGQGSIIETKSHM